MRPYPEPLPDDNPPELTVEQENQALKRQITKQIADGQYYSDFRERQRQALDFFENRFCACRDMMWVLLHDLDEQGIKIDPKYETWMKEDERLLKARRKAERLAEEARENAA